MAGYPENKLADALADEAMCTEGQSCLTEA